MDKRFDKLNEQLQASIHNMFRECENRILSEIDKKLSVSMKNLMEIAKKVEVLENTVQELKEFGLCKVNAHESETDALKKEVIYLKSCIRKQENSIVSNDIRINGIPEMANENLTDVYLKICNAIDINPPETKALFRVKAKGGNRSNGNRFNNKAVADPAIIIRFQSPYDRNFVLKAVTSHIKSRKDMLRLSHIGFSSNIPFYINENLTPENHRIFQRAHRLKKRGVFTSAFTNRGLVYIKLPGRDELKCINDMEELSQFDQQLKLSGTDSSLINIFPNSNVRQETG